MANRSKVDLKELKLPRTEASLLEKRGCEPRLGARVRVHFDDGRWYGGNVTSGCSRRGKFEVSFDDGDKQVRK